MKKFFSISGVLIAICFSVLLSTNEKKQGFVIAREVSFLGGKLEYIESYQGIKKEVRYVGNSIHPTSAVGMYFEGWYNKILGKIIWLNIWGGGLTQELIYLEKIYPIDSLAKDSKYIGILGIAGIVPGVDIREGCDEELRTVESLVVWLNGTGEFIYSDEHMSAITNAKLYAKNYNSQLNKIRCSANNTE